MKTLFVAVYLGALLLVCGLAFAEQPAVDVNSYAYKYRNVNYVYESDGLGTIFGEKNALRRGKGYKAPETYAYRVTKDSAWNYTLYKLRYTYQKDKDGHSDVDLAFTEDGYYKVLFRRTQEF